jgi:hypothetical protein
VTAKTGQDCDRTGQKVSVGRCALAAVRVVSVNGRGGALASHTTEFHFRINLKAGKWQCSTYH